MGSQGAFLVIMQIKLRGGTLVQNAMSMLREGLRYFSAGGCGLIGVLGATFVECKPQSGRGTTWSWEHGKEPLPTHLVGSMAFGTFVCRQASSTKGSKGRWGYIGVLV